MGVHAFLGEPRSESEYRVLVVDDDPEVLRTIMRMLRTHATVQMAFDANTALHALESNLFDAVVADYSMRGPNGVWLLGQIRDRFPDLQRVLLSGHSFSEIATQLDPGLVHKFLTKPITIEQLLDSVGCLSS